MHSSVISTAVFIVIALIVLVSCEQGGSKVKARHARENATSVKSASDKSARKTSTTRNSGVASASTTTTKDTVVYNGITQFNAQ